MDTTKMVVGQEVRIHQGIRGGKGVVTKVTPEGVEVQTVEPWSAPSRLLYFDNSGMQCHHPGLPCLGIDLGLGPYEPWELDSVKLEAGAHTKSEG